MFAVVVMGIGFIMVAAMFPVAIRQRQQATDESISATIGQQARQTLSRVATSSRFLVPSAPVPDNMVTTVQLTTAAPGIPTWDFIRDSLVLGSNPRYGWAPVYRRHLGNSYAEVLYFVAQSTNTPTYTSIDSTIAANAPADPVTVPTLCPKTVNVTVAYSAAPPSLMNIQSVSTTGANEAEAAVVNGFIIVNNTNFAVNDVKVYRLGDFKSVDTTTTPPTYQFELQPGNDPTNTNESNDGSHPTFTAYILGKSLQNPAFRYNSTSNPYVGSAQDIAVFRTLVRTN
jgi:hypothetical protein